MKTIKRIIVLTIMVLTSNAISANVDPEPKKESKVSKELVTLLGTPNFEMSRNDLNATVYFIINNSNEIVVSDVVADNELIELYIKSRLNYKEIKSIELLKGHTYKVDVKILGGR